MKIGIIGSGNIGGNFGTHLARAGHQVMFSSRNPGQLTSLADQAGENAQTGSIEEAASFGEVVVLSVPFKAIEDIAKAIGDKVKGKVIIDTCNPYPGRDGAVATNVMNDDAMRQSAYTVTHFPGAKVVKALNTIYYVHLKEHAFRSEGNRTGLPIAGDDEEAKKTVSQLLQDIGFDPVDVGTIADSKVMEVDQALYNKPMPAQAIKEKLKK